MSPERETTTYRFPVWPLIGAALLIFAASIGLAWAVSVIYRLAAGPPTTVYGARLNAATLAAIIACAVAASLAVWWVVWQMLRRWRAALTDSLRHLAEQADALRALERNLDQWVEGRTEEMRQVNESLEREIARTRQVSGDAATAAPQDWAALIEEAPDPIVTLDPSGRILSVNPAAQRISGYAAGDLVGKHFVATGVLEASSVPRAAQEFALVLASHPRPPFELRMRRSDRSSFIVEVNPRLIRRGGHMMIQAIFRDITERKRVEEALAASKEYAENLINSSLDMLIAVDRERHITVFNPAAERNFGYRREEMSGRLVDLLYRDPEAGERVHEQVLQRGFFVGETVHRRKDGTAFPARVSASALCNADGQTVGMIGIVRDITAEQQADEVLRKFQRAVEQSPAMVLITDLEGRLEYVNPKFTQVAGYTLEEVRGQTPRILKGGLTPPEEYQRLWRAVTSGQEWHGELCNKTKSGQMYWVSTHVSPIRDARGVTTHFLAVQEDITARRAMEQALQMEKAQLEAVSQSMIDREARMVELKQEVNGLLAGLGRPTKYG